MTRPGSDRVTVNTARNQDATGVGGKCLRSATGERRGREGADLGPETIRVHAAAGMERKKPLFRLHLLRMQWPGADALEQRQPDSYAGCAAEEGSTIEEACSAHEVTLEREGAKTRRSESGPPSGPARRSRCGRAPALRARAYEDRAGFRSASRRTGANFWRSTRERWAARPVR